MTSNIKKKSSAGKSSGGGSNIGLWLIGVSVIIVAIVVGFIVFGSRRRGGVSGEVSAVVSSYQLSVW